MKPENLTMLIPRRIAHALLLASMLLVVSCAASEEIIEPQPPSFGQPLVEPLPLRIAYAFEPSVDREVLSTIGSSDDPTALFHLRLGRAARGAFERVFAASFVEAEDITGQAPAQEATDGIIRLSLAAARMGSGENGYVASATFELIFLDPDGTQEGSWRVSGTGTDSGERNMELAIRAAAAEAASDLAQQPAIRGWLERIGSDQVDSTIGDDR